MYTFELNKIVGAVLASILFIKVLGIAGEGLFEPQEQEKVAFPVQVQEATPAGAQKKEEKIPPLPVLLADADAAKGAKIFRKCQACHTAAKDGKNMTGPWLWNVVGRKVASEPGYSYTDAMKDHGGDWTFQRLYVYLADPQKVVPGTKMSFAGLPKPKDRADVIDYLREQSDSPEALPPVPAAPQPTPAAATPGDAGAAAPASGDQAAPKGDSGADSGDAPKAE